ncbi:hypothetical protein Q4Q34_07550 [Flavivirga abyssicola]|uniref:hypothetical protein n=1 Tax=Flavivirga abyssicola TaxID=3063533 RepID=UPI0026E0C9A4|nr:hypothetical protein [Flavivirga sp. MEBiC07777]WVK14881.1 hypothetical protein Q4Q34_07550 [Flavivirga sp. MEBiC07777]
MRKTIYILILGLILSCNSNKQLEGTWIGAYSYSENVESSMNFPIRSFVTFKNDNYFTKSFKFDYRAEKDFEKGTYSYNWKKITYNSDNENTNVVELLNNDSLIIKGVDGSNNSVFKKLNDTLKSKSRNTKLIGKRYLVKSKKYNDTLNFINDSLLIKSSNKTRNPGTKWERINENGFDILFMEMDIPLIIRNKLNGKIILTGFHKKTYNIEITELK